MWLCRKSPSSARERAIFSLSNASDKGGEASDIGFIVDGVGCSQAEKGPLEARSSFPTQPNVCRAPATATRNLADSQVLVNPLPMPDDRSARSSFLNVGVLCGKSTSLGPTNRWCV